MLEINLRETQQKFLQRWQELHPEQPQKLPEPYPPAALVRHKAKNITRLGKVLVYEHPCFDGWWVVEDGLGAASTVSFCGPNGKKNAMEFAVKLGRIVN